MKPRVIILSAFLSPFRSGAESCAEEVALRLSDDFDITIVTARLRRRLPKRGMLGETVPVVRVGFGYGFDKWLFPFLAPISVRRASRRPPQCDACIIHAVLETFAGLALHFCRYTCPRAKRMLTLQTTNRSFLKSMIVRSPHRVTAISRALSEIAKELGREDVTVIPNGLDLSMMPKREKVQGRILYVGRLEKWKGVDALLTAFADLGKGERGKGNGDSHLRIVGEGSERRNLEELSQNLGITDRVTFTGFIPIPKVYEEFADAEIFCSLTKSEALGNVFLEAQAAGCAVIGTNIGGVPDAVRDGETGLLVPPHDVHAAAYTLERLLRNAALRTRLSHAGHENAKKYDWDLIARKYSALYDSLL
jgi:glycosyltransferase involved in cell wall biosynthesis